MYCHNQKMNILKNHDKYIWVCGECNKTVEFGVCPVCGEEYDIVVRFGTIHWKCKKCKKKYLYEAPKD